MSKTSSYAYDVWLTFAVFAASALVVVAFCGCVDETNGNVVPAKDNTSTYSFKAFDFETRGHQYIRFEYHYGNVKSIDVIHDPDCEKCRLSR